MRVLCDTNILIRSAEPADPLFSVTKNAVDDVRRLGHQLTVVPQNLYEFWVVLTRPTAQNGFGKSAALALQELMQVKSIFHLLEDTPAIYPVWERNVVSLGILGKNAHDARLAAAMEVHGISHLLTHNIQDFARFSRVTVIKPSQQISIP